jgi:hypothetical protein
VTSIAHPFATGGGGTLFEYKVATLLAADVIRSRKSAHGGVVAAVRMQTGPAGFDDLQISIELADGNYRTVHAQCRHRQPFTAKDGKFLPLIAQAAALFRSDAPSLISGERRLAVVVGNSSPGHASMTTLCNFARSSLDLPDFLKMVRDHGSKLDERWNQCSRAVNTTDPADLRRILGALEVRAVDVATELARDSLDLVNGLAEAWDPPNLEAAANLANALFKHLTETGPIAGAIDLHSLQSNLGKWLPHTLGATTRRARLVRLRAAGHARVEDALRSLGLNNTEAGRLATRALAVPPTVAPSLGITTVTGEMGVGKSTELERLHLVAIDRAIESGNAPIPLLLHARDVVNRSLQTVADEYTSGLGDPSRVGVHLIIDGLDEVGIRNRDISAGLVTLCATWPNSVVIVATRPDPTQIGAETKPIKPLSPEAALDLMAMIHPETKHWTPKRVELTEVLRLPLFAIRYALDRREGKPPGVHLAQLVDSVGRHAIDNIGGSGGDVFKLLVRLACRIIDSGGDAVDLRELEATPVEIEQIMRSRIVRTIDSRSHFQLAVLAEWFAANALLREPEALELSVSSPLRAHRWRYALVQALLQGSAKDVDTVMTALLNHAPASAAWVHYEARQPFVQEHTTPFANSALEAGTRVRTAAQEWLKPWPTLLERWTSGGQFPTLGVAIEGSRLVTAWRQNENDVSEPIVSLPLDTQPASPDSPLWFGEKGGRPALGATWPWSWGWNVIQRQVDDLLKHRELLVDVESCWPELAWDYAHRILGRNPVSQSHPVNRADLEAVLAKRRAGQPHGDVHGNGWILSEAEIFAADLVRLDISQILPPWPAPDRIGRWIYDSFTTERLLTRLQLTSKAALDVYQDVVEKHLPRMAAELGTYRLLPARLVGALTPGDPNGGMDGWPQFTWYVEPISTGSKNEARWTVGQVKRQPASWWEPRIAMIGAMRGDLAQYATVSSHNGEPCVSSSTPAGSLALALLEWDLNAFRWTTKPGRSDLNSRSVRPHYR